MSLLDPQEKDYLATLQDYKDVFENEKGKRVLYHMMKSHGMVTSTFDENPLKMAFKEGSRNAVLTIINLLNINVNALEKEIKERAKNERNRRNKY